MSFQMSYKSQDLVLDIFNFRYAFQADGNDLIENTFPISNVILHLQNLFLLLSSLYFGRNLYFSKQSMKDVLAFLILKLKETNLFC